MIGLLTFEAGPGRVLDPVIAAACLAFGFVYIHPFTDGNGRIHRYLIHHVLAERGFSPPGLVFPVSAVILSEIDAYRAVLQDHSRSALPLIRWEPTEDRNVHVLNETADLYRFFDATPHAEFLFHCVEETVVRDLPQETRFLESYDRFAQRIQEIVDMPGGTVDLLFRFLRQNRGTLSARARRREFAALAENEVRRVEGIYAEEFEAEEEGAGKADAP
jgi:Fic family protein